MGLNIIEGNFLGFVRNVFFYLTFICGEHFFANRMLMEALRKNVLGKKLLHIYVGKQYYIIYCLGFIR